MSEQVPTIGRIVHYTLTAQDAEQINRRRTTGASIAARRGIVDKWPVGAQAHIGNEAREGEVFPMVITKVWEEAPYVNGQVLLDGNDVLWVSVSLGDVPGTFSWPVRA